MNCGKTILGGLLLLMLMGCGAPSATQPALSLSIPQGFLSGEGTPINNVFGVQLAVLVQRNGEPVAGISVTFTAPTSGASATFTSTGKNQETDITNSNGVAFQSSFLMANSTVGSWQLVASAQGASNTIAFQMTNMPTP